MSVAAEPRTRADKVAAIRLLVDEGLTHREIAAQLGMTRSAIRNLLNDPDGSKQRARRETYTGVCEECGGETRSNGTSQPSRICADCAAAINHETRYWTRARVIEAMQRYAAEYGHPPTAQGWMVNRPPGYPNVSVVQREFGSWRAAVAAAGFGLRNWHRWSPELVLEAIRRWVDEHGELPRCGEWQRSPTDIRPTAATVFHYFGSWNKGIEAAGYEPRVMEQRPRVPTDEIIAWFRTEHERTGRVPRSRDYRAAHHRPNLTDVRRTFGCWMNAIDAADLPRPKGCHGPKRTRELEMAA